MSSRPLRELQLRATKTAEVPPLCASVTSAEAAACGMEHNVAYGMMSAGLRDEGSNRASHITVPDGGSAPLAHRAASEVDDRHSGGTEAGGHHGAHLAWQLTQKRVVY